MFDTKKLIQATVLYADIFDWPLTQEELRLWCIGVQPTVLPRMKKPSHSRRMREHWAKKKWEIAKHTARFLRVIPSIVLAGVTGGLSRNNVKKSDDIDFFCVTSPGTLWISRLLVIIIVELLGVRRRPGETNVADKICLNMFMSEDALSVKEKDLFAAYEVLQMVPLWARDGTYKKFLQANRWVKKFLPNAWKKKYLVSSIKYQGKTQNGFISLILNTFTLILTLFEPLARIIQLWYMRHRRTTEVIAHGVLRFHPRDARDWIKSAFEQRLSRYNLPLDKIFYYR